jgi:hypothetical protein
MKTSTKLNPAFTAAVAQVKSDLADWRKRRKSQDHIPELLWYEMTQIARSYGLSPVSQAFRVSYYELKRRVLFKPLTTTGLMGAPVLL